MPPTHPSNANSIASSPPRDSSPRSSGATRDMENWETNTNEDGHRSRAAGVLRASGGHPGAEGARGAVRRKRDPAHRGEGRENRDARPGRLRLAAKESAGRGLLDAQHAREIRRKT